jgi:hypothetical protein
MEGITPFAWPAAQWPSWAPAALAVVVATAVYLVLRPHTATARVRAARYADGTETRGTRERRFLAESREPDRPRAAERREGLRRQGVPVPVRVDAPGSAGAVVIDRSTGGLCLSLDRAVPAGRVLRVRAENAPADSPWVAVEVRHCRPAEGRRWHLGCRFVERPPWNVLLMFG